MPFLSALPVADLAASVAAAAPAAAPALLPDWLNPQNLLQEFGDHAFWAAVFIVFAECGLLIGFFLPGDSLLFTVGMFLESGYITHPVWLACAILTLSAFLGNVCGYEIGRRAGPAVFERPNSRFFKKQHVEKTSAFFAKYGARAIVLARFVPIVRTFITVTAGAAAMPRQAYFLWSAVGAVLWATGVTLLGVFLGGIPVVKENIEAGLLLIVAVSVLPIVIEVLRARLRDRGRAGTAAGESTITDVVADDIADVTDEPEDARRP
ncbi:membrane-associated protein [Kineococcus xinjiangensis]|uniref:Membrane-associated protein n=1 Tax=Kineococcus xinjiangensis TaxID=512762 RepID=A0A2S6IUT4_9ACTN|nr:VTT domain-containing protein [Kineococcus xinjiangensis]PPK97968.1 membrane-associated protein [Kineococcus xinjiangensis]